MEKKQAQDEEIEERDQTRQYEPSVRSGIMQTSDDKTDGGHEQNQGKDVFERTTDGWQYADCREAQLDDGRYDAGIPPCSPARRSHRIF